MLQVDSNSPILKRLDGTFEITHNGYPYHVCPLELDPANLYDVDEVAGLWDNLPDGDPRKQLESAPPNPEVVAAP
jgi:hypothetical protein